MLPARVPARSAGQFNVLVLVDELGTRSVLLPSVAQSLYCPHAVRECFWEQNDPPQSSPEGAGPSQRRQSLLGHDHAWRHLHRLSHCVHLHDSDLLFAPVEHADFYVCRAKLRPQVAVHSHVLPSVCPAVEHTVLPHDAEPVHSDNGPHRGLDKSRSDHRRDGQLSDPARLQLHDPAAVFAQEGRQAGR
uniref:(northern house mosquito) hypothetical protein n=1 Tax=Culex pipiens TaxID=7175 RepID=A0A8D8NVB5_CULPI